jgi:alpha-tubulin suppressor-like RCC1 family protein
MAPTGLLRAGSEASVPERGTLRAAGSVPWRALLTITLLSLAIGGALGRNQQAQAAGSGAAWGENEFAELGDGTNMGPEKCKTRFFEPPCSKVPIAVNGLGEASAIAAGSASTEPFGLALLTNGTVMAWGGNSVGQLGDGTSTGPEKCKLSGGAEPPCSKVPIAVSGLGETGAIAAGGAFGLALLKNGTVMAWGNNEAGQLGDGKSVSEQRQSDVPVKVSGLSEVVAISAGANYALALLKNGTAMAWGQNNFGQLGNGTTTLSDIPVPVSGLSEVAAFAAGNFHSLALLRNGTVMAWGANEAGQLGDGTSTGPETCQEGVFTPACSRTPVPVSGLSEVTAIAAGGCTCGAHDSHSLAVLKGGGVKAWGANRFGQLGDGTTTGPEACKIEGEERACAKTPVPVSGLTEATAVSAGGYGSLALSKGGTVSAWGLNENGELGNGTNTGPEKCKLGSYEPPCSRVPIAVPGLANVSTVSDGGTFGLAVGTLLNLPTITKVEPNNGPAAGGTSVTITGTNFTGATAVKFGSANAASFTVNSQSSITAVSPSGTGAVEITVTTPIGTNVTTPAATFDYAPTVSAVEPTGGPLAGGTSVTLTGTNFTGATAVHFGTAAATSFTVNSATSITAVSPAAGIGSVHVTVTTPGGTSPTTKADEFSYGPAVRGMVPRSGSHFGGTSVTILGVNFSGASAVKFGSANATNVTVRSPTEIVAVSPAGGPGTVDVTVTTPEGTSPTSEADTFYYPGECEEGHAPAVTSVTPTSGPSGTSVLIKGERFFQVVCTSIGSSVRRVFFGNEEATFKGGEHEGEIIATAPPGSGTVDVRVEGRLTGASPVSPADRFAYGALPPPTPTVGTCVGPGPTQTTATLCATVNPNGVEVSGCEFEYGPTSAYGFSVPCTPPPGSGTSPVTVTATISGLTPNTTYHFRVVATNSGGASQGSDQSLKTLPNPPTVVTGTASSITGSSATLNATVNPNGGESQCKFEYGTTTGYGSPPVACSSLPGSGTSPVAVSAPVTGLANKTTYHFRISATNPGGTSQGPDQTFNVTSTHVYKNGVIGAEGETVREIAWGTVKFNNASYGEVECHTIGAGFMENPTGGGSATGKVQGYFPYECVSATCTASGGTAIELTPENLPWSTEATEVAGGAFRLRTGNRIKAAGAVLLRVNCVGVKNTQFSAEDVPRVLNNGISIGSAPDEEEFDQPASGELESEALGGLKLAGKVKFEGYGSQELIELKNP